MKFDWQSVAVALVVAGALLYAARRGVRRLRSFGVKGGGSCSTGCGKCGEVDAPLRQTNLASPVVPLKGVGRRRP